MPDELCKVLPWDSDFFGVRIARYSGDSLTEGAAATALEWCRHHSIDCLYLLLRGDPENIAIAERYGFVHADTRMTLALRLPDTEQAHSDVRPAEASDIPALRAIARAGHRDGRFYHDPHFPKETCDAFYGTWIENSCRGWADRVLVTSNGLPTGYISCHVESAAQASIGLVAVGEEYRRNGYGGELIRGALQYFQERGVETVRVVTQERNRGAMHLYKRHGFSVESSGLYYHAWPREMR